MTLFRRFHTTPLDGDTLQVIQRCADVLPEFKVASRLLEFGLRSEHKLCHAENLAKDVRGILLSQQNEDAKVQYEALSEAVSRFDDLPAFSIVQREALGCFAASLETESTTIDENLQWALIGFCVLAIKLNPSDIPNSIDSTFRHSELSEDLDGLSLLLVTKVSVCYLGCNNIAHAFN